MGFLPISWTPWRAVLGCFLSVGTIVMMDALHLLQTRKPRSNVRVKIVLQHSSSANSRRSNSDWRANIPFFLYIRLYSYFSALFPLTDSQFLGEQANQTVSTTQKTSKLFWPRLCLCNTRMYDAGKWSTRTKNVKHYIFLRKYFPDFFKINNPSF